MPDDPTDQTADRPAPSSSRPSPAPAAVPRRRAAAKAPAKRAPSKRVADRMQVLEDRLAEESPTAAKRAPVKKAPAKKAPVKKAPAKKAPVKKAPAPLPYLEDRPDALPERAVDVRDGDRSREVFKDRRRGRGAAVLLVVLLLAVAAGLGTAALVKNRAPVWQSHATVRLLPGPASSDDRALRDGQQRYVEKVRNASFTGVAALKAGMPDSEVTKTVTASPGKDGALVLEANATTRKGAIALANASAVTLVDTVVSDQEQAASAAGDRLGATSAGPTTSASRTTPSNQNIALAGVLAAVGVLLVAGGLIALGRSKKK